MGFIKGTISVGRFSVSDNTVMGNDFEERIVLRAFTDLFPSKRKRSGDGPSSMIP